jgi:hypothetical protein
MFHCDRTGRDYQDDSDGIYDDDEWISWDWINGEIDRQEFAKQYPEADPAVAQIFIDLVEVARNYCGVTVRYLQIWGELGELYAEIEHGIVRHRPHTPGSDGRMGNDVVEIKTISPEKGSEKVVVSRKGNFNKLLVVKISDKFEFESRMLDRDKFCKGKTKGKGLARVAWQSMPDGKDNNSRTPLPAERSGG